MRFLELVGISTLCRLDPPPSTPFPLAANPNPAGRVEWRRFYQSAAWRKLRCMKIAANPISECGCGSPTQDVHHRIDVRDRPDLALAWDNLVSMAKSCHSKETAARRNQIPSK